MAASFRVLGIDPGTRATGWALLEVAPEPRLVLYDVIAPAASLPVDARLLAIFETLRIVIGDHRPDVLALEEPFVGANVRSAMAVGEARTAAVLAAGLAGVPVHRYPPARVKQVVAGDGRGDKAQVRQMLALQLGIPAAPDDLNASDAAAVALCHVVESRAAALLAESVAVQVPPVRGKGLATGG